MAASLHEAKRIGGVSMDKNLYEVLGVDREANDETLRKAYRELARKWHPDRYPKGKAQEQAEEKMKEINEAYGILSDKDKRAMYDLQNPVSGNVYEHYAQKQPKSKPWFKKKRASSDIEKEKQRKAVFQFLELEYQHKSDIFDMFDELANGAVSDEFSDEEYLETLELIFEEAEDCIAKLQGIVTAAKERKIEGLEVAFKQAQEAIEELTKKRDETPSTLKKAQYVEETRRLTEKVNDLMEGFGPRLYSITHFNLLDKTWEFHSDDELNAAREGHKKEVDEFLEDIQWVQEAASERNIKIGTIVFNGRDNFTIDECKKTPKKSSQMLSLNLQNLRKAFWEKCEYSKSKTGEIILDNIGSSYIRTSDYKGDFVCPPNISYIDKMAFYFADSFSSISIPAHLVKEGSEIQLPDSSELKSLIFTFGPNSQTVDVSSINERATITRQGDYILVGNQDKPKDGFAVVNAENAYLYDTKKLCALSGVKTVKQLEELSYLWGDYSKWIGHELQMHTWAQAIGRLSDPYIMNLLPVTIQAVKEWNAMDKTNFEKVLSSCNEVTRPRAVRLYIALGALNGGACHTQAEYLISKLNVNAMYRSRLERCPEEKRVGQDTVFSVPKEIVDFVEENVNNREFLLYVFAFLEGYKLFVSEAKKAGVGLSAEFVIERTAQYIFHSKVSDDGVEFVKEFLEKEKSVDVKIADKIMMIYSIAQKEIKKHGGKNIIETTDVSHEDGMHYRFLDLSLLQTYLMLGDEFMFRRRWSRTTAYYGIETENVFTSSNSHAIEVVDGENNSVATVILNLFDEGELFADIVSCDDKSIDIIEAIRRAVIDQKKCNNKVTGVSIGMNEAPRTDRYNKWRKVIAEANVAWAKEVVWIKFEYRFKSRVLGNSNKAYRVRFMVDGEGQDFDELNPYDDPKISRKYERRNRRRGGWW